MKYITIIILLLSFSAIGQISPITGDSTLCAETTVFLSNVTTGGSWSTSDSTIASIDSFGIVTAVGAGTAYITYTTFNAYCSAFVDTAMLIISSPVVPPISGILGVCSGDSTVLFDTLIGGTWSSSDSTIAIAFGWFPPIGIVLGYTTGIATISYSVTNSCGTTTVTTNVSVNMPPYITTNTIVSCQTLATDTSRGGVTHIISGTSGCIDVCDSSVVRYYANGVAGSHFTWNISGGIIDSNYPPNNDSIDVQWSNVVGFTGNVILYDTFSHCISMASVCIKVIAKPEALFAVLPSLTVATGTIDICSGDSVLFHDLSTADSSSPIVSWYWNFGDGGFSSVRNPGHQFTGPAIDTVTLIVKNACNCTDSFRVVLNISANPGPTIQCASIACDSEIAKYSTTPDSCGIYYWSVIGGTIVAGGTATNTISVLWDAVGIDGYGYVSLSEPCGGCTDTTTIKIPVILKNATIEGPNTICVGHQYEYQLPLWGGTRYMWGVLSYPSAKVGFDDDYKLIVQFNVQGVYTVHAWYQNEIKLCGGNVFKTITVVPADTIVGAINVCPNVSETYTLPFGVLGNWTLSDSAGIVITTSAISETIFTYTFTTPGVYLLSATGGFCADPITITVNTPPPPVDSISGPDTICLNRVYTYAAHSDVPGTIYNWTITGGTLSPSSGSPSVTVVWTVSAVHQITVNRISTTPPYCSGVPLIKNVVKEIINPVVTGNINPCSNSLDSYSCSYTRGETYDWAIFPPSAGSIVGGNHNPGVRVEWNNTSVLLPTAIVVTVHKCDLTVKDTLFGITLHPSPSVTIADAPVIACPGSPVTFITNFGDSTYLWSFGDGTTTITTGLDTTVTHSFPPNTTSGNINYTVQVTGIIGLSFGCPPFGTAVINIPILPGPTANASTANFMICHGDTAIITGTVTDNVTGLHFQWYDNGIAIGGATDTTYLTTMRGNFSFVVIADNGCSATSNIIPIDTCLSGGDTCSDEALAHTNHNCATINLIGTYATSSSPYWIPLDGVPLGGGIPPGMTATVSYDVPGIYRFGFISGCYTYFVHDTIGIVPRFRYGLRCAMGVMDSVSLTDVSAYLSWWHITSVSYTDVTTSTYLGAVPGTGFTLNVLLPVGVHNISETVSGTCPDGPFSCTINKTITVPNRPVASFTDSLSPICEHVPIHFNSTSSGGIIGFNWNFGDGSSILLPNPERTYNWSSLLITNPNHDTVSMVVTDTLGCKDSITRIVNIYENLLNGHLAPLLQTVCRNSLPVVINYVPVTGSPITYNWSNGITTSVPSLNVDSSGSYWVTVFDNHQCQFSAFPAATVRVVKPPHPIITGKQDYCVNDTIRLNGYAGPNPPLIYKWLIHDSLIGTNPSVKYYVSDTGNNYAIKLIIGIIDVTTGLICWDTSATDSLRIYPLPPLPSIADTVMDCNSYQIKLAASDIETGYYNWSDGSSVATDIVYMGGPYRVWFTNLQGCTSHTDITLPYAPGTYFPYFPTGCYTLCKEQLPLTLYGPPDVYFEHWDWLGSLPDLSGTMYMSPYSITGAGDYGWYLDNGLCSQKFGYMDVTVVPCNKCQGINVNPIIACDASNPASFKLTLNIIDPVPGTTNFTVGTDMGPVIPFNVSMTNPPVVHTLTLTYTTFLTTLPSIINVEIEFTLPDGSKCFKKIPVPVPNCIWVAERQVNNTNDSGSSNLNVITTALMVYPNPASNEVTLSYDYGNEGKTGRTITIYNEMGQRMQYNNPQDTHGEWKLNIQDWIPGIYLVRMDGDGKTVQLQKFVVSK